MHVNATTCHNFYSFRYNGRRSAAITRMVRQPAATWLKDCQTTAPSLMLRLQPWLWQWTILPTILPARGPSSPQCNCLLWLNVLLAGNCEWRHWEPFYLPYHEPPLVVEWQRHTCSFLLNTKPLWHRRKWKNERPDQLTKVTFDHDIDTMADVHYADLKPLVNSYIQQLVQIEWDVAVHGRDLYLLKPTLGRPKKFQHLNRAEEVVITRLRIGHTKATKSRILSRGLPTTCHHCGKTLTIDHMLLECAVL